MIRSEMFENYTNFHCSRRFEQSSPRPKNIQEFAIATLPIKHFMKVKS